MSKTEIIEVIKRLKEDKNAVILAHYYTIGDIQDIADFVGLEFLVVHEFLHAGIDEEIIGDDVDVDVQSIAFRDGFVQTVEVTFRIVFIVPRVAAVPNDVGGGDTRND